MKLKHKLLRWNEDTYSDDVYNCTVEFHVYGETKMSRSYYDQDEYAELHIDAVKDETGKEWLKELSKEEIVEIEKICCKELERLNEPDYD